MDLHWLMNVSDGLLADAGHIGEASRLGVVIERLFLQHIRKLDHLYGLILTFGLALIIEGLFRNTYGSSGEPYAVPEALQGGRNLGFMFQRGGKAQ